MYRPLGSSPVPLPMVPVVPSTVTLTVPPRRGVVVDTLAILPSPVTSSTLLAWASMVFSTAPKPPALAHSRVAVEVPGLPAYTSTACVCAAVHVPVAVSMKKAGVLAPAATGPSGIASGCPVPRPSAPPAKPVSRTHRSERAVLLLTR